MHKKPKSKPSMSDARAGSQESTREGSTDDEVALLAGAVVDLDVARLGAVRDAGDVHGLPAGRDRELDLLGHGCARLLGVLDAAADGDALVGDAEVGVHGRALRHRLGAAEGDGDVVRRAATAAKKGV